MGRVIPGVLIPRVGDAGAQPIWSFTQRDQRVLDETFLTMDRMFNGRVKRAVEKAKAPYLNRNPQQVPPNYLWALYGIKQSKGGR